MRKLWESFKKFCKKYESVISVLFSVAPVIGQFVSKTIFQRVAVAFLGLSAAGFVSLASQEEFIGTARRPVPGDKPTYGYGSTNGVSMGATITPGRALVLLLKETSDEYGAAVQKCVKYPLYQHEYDEYVNLAYNIGSSAFCQSTLVQFANSGEYGKACGQLVRFVYGPGRKPLKGLQKRRVEQYLNCVKEPNA